MRSSVLAKLARLVLDLRIRSRARNEESSEWEKGRGTGYALAADWLEEILLLDVRPDLEVVERWAHKLSARTEYGLAMPTVNEAIAMYKEAAIEGLLDSEEVPSGTT